MSSEAEKAAKWGMVEELRDAKQHLLTLETEMAKISKAWASLAPVIQRPGGYVFRVDAEGITVGQPGTNARGPVSYVSRSDVDWDSLSRLIADYQTTRDKIQELGSRLHDAGMPT